ncbi:MAG: Gfo/Idh/MocA family protein [Opitutales bacterium]
MSKPWKIAGLSFEHMHQGDLLRMVKEHPNAEIVGICDANAERMQGTAEKLGIPQDRIFTDVDTCLKTAEPDMVMLCPATAGHAEWTELVAPYGVHVFVEKPFAASLAEADRMIAAVEKTGKQLVINWPLRWYPPHVTTKRLIDEGVIGELQQVHYYDGNRGPARHGADKVELEPGPKNELWWYQKAKGGGSLLDYLGYGVTLGTWFHGGRTPIEITTMVDQPKGLEVDEHSVTVARYATGLSKYETRWGTFSDPWTHQPQPKCGFVVVGSKGTISSYDYEKTIRLQTADNPEGTQVPVDTLEAPYHNPIHYVLHCLETGEPIEGPLSPEIARIGQQIVDLAYRSAAEKKTLPFA